jgi:hypothetical protein
MRLRQMAYILLYLNWRLSAVNPVWMFMPEKNGKKDVRRLEKQSFDKILFASRANPVGACA